MESFSVRTNLNLADWNALMLEAGKRVNAQRQKASWLTRSASNLLWLLLAAAYAFMLIADPPLIRPGGIAISIAGFFSIWWLQYFIQRRAYAPSARGAFLGDHEFTFESNGFHSRRDNSEAFNRWSLITDITHSNDHVFLWIDTHSGYAVPARDLPAPMTAQAAADQLNRLIADAAAAPAESAPVPMRADEDADRQPPPTPPRFDAPAGPPTVAQELVALARLQTWGVVDGARLFGRDATLILLGLFSLSLWIGLDRLDYEGEVDLFVYGLGDNASLVLAVLALAWLLSRISRPRIEMRQGLLLVLAFLPVFVVMLWAVGWLPKLGYIVMFVLMMAWAERFLGAGMRSLTGTRQWAAVTAMLAGVIALVYLSTMMYFSPGFWIERDANAEHAAETRRQNEQLVFEQSARLNADISSLAPREAGRANVFFVGFAGYGGQRVFTEEIGLAAKRVDAAYGVKQRSVLLINDRRDSLKHPLANAPALRHTLNALSQRMNVDEDILFLALSSHGSEDGTVSVSSELGYWRDLDARELADMLREAGIRWRIIVVSACYAGSFIEPLRDDYTIIIAAAAEDRTSFGCSNENDLTYFGEAFYRDALPEATSLHAAFDTARTTIQRRETLEGRTASNPQAHFGAALEKKLAAIEAARSAR